MLIATARTACAFARLFFCGFCETILLMVIVSLLGAVESKKAFDLTKISFKVEPSTLALIVLTVLLLAGLYVKFWKQSYFLGTACCW